MKHEATVQVNSVAPDSYNFSSGLGACTELVEPFKHLNNIIFGNNLIRL